MIIEIRKRLIVDCTFIDSKPTIKALIDPKSQYNSISKTLAKKMDLYISREWGSRGKTCNKKVQSPAKVMAVSFWDVMSSA